MGAPEALEPDGAGPDGWTPEPVGPWTISSQMSSVGVSRSGQAPHEAPHALLSSSLPRGVESKLKNSTGNRSAVGSSSGCDVSWP